MTKKLTSVSTLFRQKFLQFSPGMCPKCLAIPRKVNVKFTETVSVTHQISTHNFDFVLLFTLQYLATSVCVQQ